MLPCVNRSFRKASTTCASLGIAIGVAVSIAALGSTASAGPLHSLPGASEHAAAEAPPAPILSDAERMRRGLVTIEREGRLLALGTVLQDDGRILTSFAALSGGDEADVRYADGTTAHAKLGHRDAAWDLALLVPLAGKWTDGLVASEADASVVALKTFVARGPRALAAAPVLFKKRSDARAKEGDTLPGALELTLKGAASPIGAPVLDGNGNVVAIFVRACKAENSGESPTGSPCVAETIGAPVSALRHFLAHTPPTAVRPPPWLGIRGEADVAGTFRGVRVVAVANGSPADKGGLKANLDRDKSDLIFAVEGQPVESPERLAQLIGQHSAGDGVKLLVFGADRVREVTIQLRAAP